MIEEHPEIEQWEQPQEKLVLPAYLPETPLPTPEMNAQRFESMETGAYSEVRPEQLIRRHAHPTLHYPLARPGASIRKDPAYLFLVIALVVALVSGVIFAVFAGSAVAQLVSPPAQKNSVPPPPIATQSTGNEKVDLQPTFPTPSGGQGSTATSLPPTSVPATVVASPVATSQPTQDTGGAVSLQITSLPQQVTNNTFVPVTVTANQPGVSVKLVVFYNALPFYYTTTAQITDDNGNATLLWQVRVFARKGQIASARVTAVTQNQDGQQISSPTITVMVANGA
jgi:hypothetical protein